MVSIIVPVYNVENYLSRCIESIQKQTIHDLEIILVDDGSTDSSGMICERYAANDKRIKVFHQKNAGQISARNAGVLVASGEYIGFVDSDDWIDESMISTLYTAAVTNDADVVMEGMLEEVSGNVYSCRNVLPEGVYKSEQERAYLLKNMISCEDYFRLGIQPYLWNKLFRTELVKKIMPAIDGRIRIGEDAAAVYSILREAECTVILSTCHYHYCINEMSIMMRGVSETEELQSVQALYIYFTDKFLETDNGRKCFEKSINSYVINNLLTRAYRRFVHLKQNSILFPFEGIQEGDMLIVYGAGALGKAVYKYVSGNPEVRLKGWVDGNAKKYQQLSMPVVDIDTLEICASDKIVVAVFSESVFQQIRHLLLAKGIKERQIFTVAINQEEEQNMLDVLVEERIRQGRIE